MLPRGLLIRPFLVVDSLHYEGSEGKVGRLLDFTAALPDASNDSFWAPERRFAG